MGGGCKKKMWARRERLANGKKKARKMAAKKNKCAKEKVAK